MKRLIPILIATITTLSSFAQINGNGKLTTKVMPYEPIEVIHVEMYAKVMIDCQAKGISITAESNLIDQIDFTYDGKELTIDQGKWIEPSLNIQITIGAPDLKVIHQGTWDETTVTNIDTKVLRVNADLGTVNLQGKVNTLILKSKQGVTNATDLVATDAEVMLSSSAKAKLNVTNNVICNIEEGGRLTFLNEPANCTNCKSDPIALGMEVKYIDFKIKNNTWGRKHFAVVGPKPNGGNFSYGFPLMPGQVRKERWTTGTKIYRSNSAGIKTLLVTITAEDEGKTVKLFAKN